MTVQRLVIESWHPATSANRSHDHWRKIQKAHHDDQTMAWTSAMQAGWEFVPGKVRLTITLVYPRRYRVDADNLAARCKGLIDGLKEHGRIGPGGLRGTVRGFFADDSTEYLELTVKAEVEKGVKQTILVLESIDG